MTELQQMQNRLMSLSWNLDAEAVTALDAESLRRKAIQIANEILDVSRPQLTAAQNANCLNPSCRRLIRENDPVYRGYCSTMCRESFISRTMRVVSEKYDRAVQQ